jgi:hypothetical protein
MMMLASDNQPEHDVVVQWSCYIQQLMMILASDNQPEHDVVVQWSCYIRQLMMILASDRYSTFGELGQPSTGGLVQGTTKVPIG